MDSSLVSEIQRETQAEICRVFWCEQPRYQKHTSTTQPYWQYFRNKCIEALQDQGRHVALRTYRDVVEVVHQLKADTPRIAIKASLRKKLTITHTNENELLDNSINLATSLLLMINCKSIAILFSGRTEISWTDGSIREYLKDYFSGAPILSHNGVKLQKNFTARNLCRIAGMGIIWTDNLVDHLRLTEDDNKVHIFHHAAFLECQNNSQESLLPTGLAEETLQTLALLFPSSDPALKKWFVRLSESSDLDNCLIGCGQLTTDNRQIERFTFWRDRLVTLKQVFDEAQPKSLAQWWHDRRNGEQWYTFWVAVVILALTILFGLIQCVEGGLQVYTSFKSLSSS